MQSFLSRFTPALGRRAVLALFVLSITAAAVVGKEKRGSRLYEEMAAKRNSLSSFHQEFQVTQVFRTSHGEQPSKRKLTLDAAS